MRAQGTRCSPGTRASIAFHWKTRAICGGQHRRGHSGPRPAEHNGLLPCIRSSDRSHYVPSRYLRTKCSNIALGTFERDSAILLLTENVPYANALTWSDWGRIAEWVGDLPIALDLLNRSLVLNAISPKGFLDRTESSQPSSPTRELDRLRESLRGQIPEKAPVFGITEAFSISVDKLDKISRRAGMVIAQLASAPVPEDFSDALPAKLGSPAVRACLRSRHFVSDGGTSNKGIRVFGVMHRLTADFLRILAAKSAPGSPEIACNALQKLMTRERCDDARQSPWINLPAC